MKQETIIDDPVARLRLGWAECAIFALQHCRPDQADDICARWMEVSETDGPQHDLFGRVRGDAAMWADCAPPHEIAAYTIAGLARLRNSPTGLKTRKAVFVELWQGFIIADRKAFVDKVAARGRFAGRAA